MRKIILILAALLLGFSAFCQIGEPLPAWQKGNYDIHFISTARGESIFMVMPDGTTMLLDAGESKQRLEQNAPTTLPDDSRSAGAWVADYVRMFHPQGKDAKLDYVLISHYHDDHIGSFYLKDPEMHPSGEFQMTHGITDALSEIPVVKYIDRGDFPLNTEDFNPDNKDVKWLKKLLPKYRAFTGWLKKEYGTKVEEFKVGTSKQIVLVKDPKAFKNFEVHNLFANGDVDNGEEIVKANDGKYISENNASTGVRVQYGNFAAYFGGDAEGISSATGTTIKKSVEYNVAKGLRSVDVAKMDHHGCGNANCIELLRALKANIWVASCWSVRQPVQSTMEHIRSPKVFKGPREIYCTWEHPAHRITYADWFDKPSGKGKNAFGGHIVIRVAPDTETYDVYVLDELTPQRNVKLVRHFESKSKQK